MFGITLLSLLGVAAIVAITVFLMSASGQYKD
jgi:hypothetical protein